MKLLGIDVSKAKLDCTLLDPLTDKRKTKVVPNSPGGFEILADWLIKHGTALNEVHGVLDATGIYHEQAALWLAEHGATVSIANPAQVKDFARGTGIRTKTDGIDSAVLARYGALLNPPPWRAPAIEVLELKALLGRLEALEADLRRELNRREKGRIQRISGVIQESLDRHIGQLEQEVARLQTAINDHIDRHPHLKEDRERLLSIPAIGEKTANRMLAVMHGHWFRSAEQAAAFLGLVPVEHRSGSSVQKRPKLARNGDAKTRAVLYMAAISAIRYNPDIKALYQRLCARGKAKMAALGAAMRKLVHLCFGVLKSQLPYQPHYAMSS